MRSNKSKGPTASLSLFIDDSEESEMAKEALRTLGELCNFYDVRSLNIPPGDEIEPPTLYAPEGTFCGWKQIQTFIRIPPTMRYSALVTT